MVSWIHAHTHAFYLHPCLPFSSKNIERAFPGKNKKKKSVTTLAILDTLCIDCMLSRCCTTFTLTPTRCPSAGSRQFCQHPFTFFFVPIALQTTNLPRIGFTFFLLVLYNTLGVQLLVYISSHERKKQRLLYYHHNCFSHNYTCLQKERQLPKVQASCPFPFVHVTNRSILLSHSSWKKRVSSNVLLFYRQSFPVSVIGLS